MKLIRAVVFTLGIVLLGVGYAASQVTLLLQPDSYPDFVEKLNSPAVSKLALLMLIACMVFPFLGKPDEANTQ